MSVPTKIKFGLIINARWENGPGSGVTSTPFMVHIPGNWLIFRANPLKGHRGWKNMAVWGWTLMFSTPSPLQFFKWSNLALSWAHLPLCATLMWPWPTWPLTLTLVTFDLQVKSQWNYKKSLKKFKFFQHGDLDLWPMTLTFIRDLDII